MKTWNPYREQGIMYALVFLFGMFAVVNAHTNNLLCTLTCPNNIFTVNDPGTCGASVYYIIELGDCSTYTLSPNLPSGSVFPVGETTITATSNEGTSCSFTIWVEDSEPPSVNCPGNMVINLDPGLCSAFVNYNVTITDNCGPNLYFEQYQGLPSGSEFPIGTTTNCFYAVDCSVNLAQCCFDVTVLEYPNPTQTLACNDNVQISLDGTGCVEVLADQILEGGPYHCYDDYIVEILNPSGFPIGNTVCCSDIGITKAVQVTDPETGNKCWGTITTEDKLPPVTQYCPPHQTITCDDYLQNYAESVEQEDYSVLEIFGAPGFYDNCTFEVNNEVNLNLNNCLIGGITRSWTATDGSGQSVVCSQTISINHISDWVVEFPADFLGECSNGQLPDTGEPQIFQDECELIGVSHSDQLFTVVPDACYKIVRTWNVINWCIYTTFGYDAYLEAGHAECNLNQDWDGDGDKDCRTFRDGYNSTGNPGTPDGYITYKQVIKVIDNEAPNFTIPPIDGWITDSDCNTNLTLPYPDIMDDCSLANEVTITGDFGMFANITGDVTIANVGMGEYEITYSVTDNCGNTAYETVVVKIDDYAPPFAICKNSLDVQLGESGTGILYAEEIDNGSYDNCSAVSFFAAKWNPFLDPPYFYHYYPQLEFSSSEIGVNTVILLVLDFNPSNAGVTLPDGSIFLYPGNPIFYGSFSTCLANVQVFDPETYCSTPTIQARNISFPSYCGEDVTISWKNGDGGRRIVKINTTNNFSAPVDGTDPPANPVYSGFGEQVVYNGSSNSVAVSGLSANSTYWFRVYEANCTGAYSFYQATNASNNPRSIKTKSSIQLSFSTTPSCQNTPNGTATINVTGGNNPKTYLWNTIPPTMTKTITGVAAGVYTVTVTDAKGCSAIGEATVPQLPELSGVISVTPNNNATFKAIVTPIGGLGPNYQYRKRLVNGDWNPFQPIGVFDNLVEGMYYFEIRDACNASIELPQNIGIGVLAECAPLQKKIFGWHDGTSVPVNYFQWDLLSDYCLFSYEVNSDGNDIGNNFAWAWNNNPYIVAARDHWVNTHICIKLFSGHYAFLSNPTARQTLINNLLALLPVNEPYKKGVNVDFEAMGSSSLKPLFTTFITELCSQMHNAGKEVSIALQAPSVNAYDFPALISAVDYFIWMGYDYHAIAGKYLPVPAGPTDPLYPFVPGGINLAQSVTRRLAFDGIPPSKLVLALPYYGVASNVVNTECQIPTSCSLPQGIAKPALKTIKENGSGFFDDPQYDEGSQTAYYCYTYAGNNRQCFINNARSMGRRFDLINQRDLAGVGIWQLGFDGEYSDFWDLLRDKFSDCTIIPCRDTIYDMGGPLNPYYHGEDYTFTIQPTESSYPLSLEFQSFALGAGDYLRLYDGPDISGPLINTYTGSNNPGTITATGNALTLQFHSDLAASTTGPGYFAIWDNCNQQKAAGKSIDYTTTDTLLDKESLSFGLIYPQPANDIFYLNIFNPGDDLSAKFEFFNAIGQRIKNQTTELYSGENTLEFSIDHLEAGIYFLTAQAGGMKKTFKVIKGVKSSNN